MILRWLMRRRAYTYAGASITHEINADPLKHVISPRLVHTFIKAGTNMIATQTKNIPDFFKGETWTFPGQISYSDGSTAPDITSDTITLYLYDSNGSLVFSQDADVSGGSAGLYTFTAQKAKTNLCTKGAAYDAEIKWYYNAGADNQMLYKGRVNCLKSNTNEA